MILATKRIFECFAVVLNMNRTEITRLKQTQNLLLCILCNYASALWNFIIALVLFAIVKQYESSVIEFQYFSN